MTFCYRVNELRLGFFESEDDLCKKCAEKLGINCCDIISLSIYRRSLDLRHGKEGRVYSVDIQVKNSIKNKFAQKILPEENKYEIPHFSFSTKPVVIGFGPAGMFAALLLAKAGLCPVVYERGKTVEERIADVDAFFKSGKLDPESNVQFGEGGAGTFSDGKLNTLLKDKNFRGRFVLEEFVKSGANEEILYDAKPHVGTDVIRNCVKNIRKEIISLGGKIEFGTKFNRFSVKDDRINGIYLEKDGKEFFEKASTVFLAIGHSARDTVKNLHGQNVEMQIKPFSVGVRIEHLQSMINKTQFKDYAEYILSPADYKLSYKTSSGRILYTFCMCPGGVVIPATSDSEKTVTNGMSNFARDERNANSALLCSVDTDKFDNVLDAIAFQEQLEEKAFRLGGSDYKAPCQKVGDFISGEKSTSFGSVIPTFAVGTRFADISEIFPKYISDTIREGIKGMGTLLCGFDDADAVITAVESRATSPFRIVRNDFGEANFKGVYPIGEGAGYAGGIMSSAMDGMKAVEKYFLLLKQKNC